MTGDGERSAMSDAPNPGGRSRLPLILAVLVAVAAVGVMIYVWTDADRQAGQVERIARELGI